MTTTSNIHFGLAAWSSAQAYTIGARVSSNGNAYQALNAATSGSTAPNGTSTSVSDGAVNWKYLSSVNYTSVQAWADAIPTTLTQNVVGQIWNDGPITTTAGTPFLVLGTSGAQRSTGSFSITLTAAPGESFRDTLKGKNVPLAANSANGATFLLPSAEGDINYIDIYDSPFTLNGLQFIDPFSTSNCTIINGNANTTTTISHCILDGYAQDSGASMTASQGVMIYTNNLVVDRQATGLNGIALLGGASVVSYAINNTIVRINPTNGTESLAAGFLADTSPSIISNNIFIGYTNPVGGNGNSCLVDHCATTSPTVGFATDSGNNIFSISAVNQFVSVTTDFRIKYGADALNAGVTETSIIPTNDDILGYARPQGTAWSLGAAEYVSQFTSAATVANFRSTGAIATINNASATKSIGTIVASSTVQQTVAATSTVRFGAVSAAVAATQSNIINAQNSIGSIRAAGIVSNNSVTATVSLLPTLVASAALFQTASATASFLVSGIGTAVFSVIATATASIGAITPPTAGSTAIQEDVAASSALTTIHLTSTGSSISQSIVNASAAVTLPLTLTSQAAQYITAASAPTLSLGAVAGSSSAFQSDIATIAATLAVSPAISLLQENRQSATSAIQVKSAGTARQEDLAAGSPSIRFAGSAIVNTTYNVGGAATIGTISATSAANQSDITTVLGSIAVTATGTATNPYPATSTSSIGPIASLTSTFGAEQTIIGQAAIGPITCQASSANYVFGTSTFVFATVASATNPVPAGGTASLAPITSIVAIQNLTPQQVVGLATMSALTAASNAKQDDNVSSLITLSITPISAVANAPKLRVSQMPVETLSSGGAVRVSQATVETLSTGSNIRVSQTAIEVLTQSALPSTGRVSQVVGEILATGQPRALATQVVQEVLTGGSNVQNVRMTQIVTEVLTGGSTSQNVFMTQVVLETLISAIPLPTIGTSYIAI